MPRIIIQNSEEYILSSSQQSAAKNTCRCYIEKLNIPIAYTQCERHLLFVQYSV